MTKKKGQNLTVKHSVRQLPSVLMVVLLIGCGSTAPDDTVNFAEFEENLMSSYRMLSPHSKGSTSATGFRSTALAPVWSPHAPRRLTQATTYTVQGYPEFDLNTSWSYTLHNSQNNIWKVTVVTAYPNDSWVERTEDIYYIKDNGDGIHDAQDSFVDNNGTPNTMYKDVWRTYFSDGTSRRDVEVGQLYDQEFQYDLFDINGQIDYDMTPRLDVIPEGQDIWASNRWTSKTEFSHNSKRNHNWALWGVLGDATVEGIRYYASKGNIQTMLIVESGHSFASRWGRNNRSAPNRRQNLSSADYLFKGVIMVHINNTTKIRTIKGKYKIFHKSGRSYEFIISNGRFIYNR